MKRRFENVFKNVFLLESLKVFFCKTFLEHTGIYIIDCIIYRYDVANLSNSL